MSVTDGSKRVALILIFFKPLYVPILRSEHAILCDDVCDFILRHSVH